MSTQIKRKIAHSLIMEDWSSVRQHIRTLAVPDITDIILNVDPDYSFVIFRMLPPETATAVFSDLSATDQKRLLSHLTHEETKQLLARLKPDERTELFEELPGEVTRKLYKLLSPEDLREVTHLLGYPPESVGRLTTPDYISVRPGWTIERTLEHIRNFGKLSETVDTVYVLDRDSKLTGVLSLRDIILASPQQKVEDIMLKDIIRIRADEDQEKTISIMQQHDLKVLPVVDSKEVMVGIVTVDDILDIAQEEATRDIQLIGGVEPVEVNYSKANVFMLWRKRILWLLLLLVVDFFSSSVIAYYEETLAQVVTLALFIPMLIDSGGNTGTQSSTLIIRALSLGEIKIKDWVRVVGKEIAVGLLLGLTLGTVVFVRGFFWRGGPEIGLVVGLTMVALVLWSNLIGAILPLILSKFRLDPAVVSSPFITTAADVVGLLIYFNVAIRVLGL